MATIRIERTSEYQNALRKIQIYIDGKKVGDVENGETLDFTVDSGNRTIVAKIDWCQSQEMKLECQTNSFHNIRLSSNKSLLLTLFYTTFARKRYLKLTQVN
jgi:hypothetical protein